MKDQDGSKNVSTIVKEQLQYCRSLRRADLLAVTQILATDEECLKQANTQIMLLKADVRALNACAARFLMPVGEKNSPDKSSGQREVAASAYSVDTIERLFRRFRQVDTTDSANGIQAVSTTNQLVVIRERLQAGLCSRLLELKSEMDKEFGTAFIDMESYLRTERDTQAKSDAEHCSACARMFVELCYKFQVMVHACRGLRAAKEGLNQTVLLKALREEKKTLAERLEEADGELKRIHHSYTEMMTPELAVGLENRQRHKIEDQEADIARLKGEKAALKRDHERLLAENGRFSDATGELQAQLQSSKDQHARELAWLNPKVLAAEGRAAEIEGLVDHMNLKLSLLNSSYRKACEEIEDLKARLAATRADGPGAKLAGLQNEATQSNKIIRKLQSENERKDRLVTVAMAARASITTSYKDTKKECDETEKRLRETQGARALLEAQKEHLTGRLAAAEQAVASAGEREVALKDELQSTAEQLDFRTQENEIMQDRLDSQEMELRDFSNLQKEHAQLAASKKDCTYQLSTVSGLLKDLKQKAVSLGMGRELGLC